MPKPQDYNPYPTQPKRMESEHETYKIPVIKVILLKNKLNFSIVTYSHIYNKIL